MFDIYLARQLIVCSEQLAKANRPVEDEPVSTVLSDCPIMDAACYQCFFLNQKHFDFNLCVCVCDNEEPVVGCMCTCSDTPPPPPAAPPFPPPAPPPAVRQEQL